MSQYVNGVTFGKCLRVGAGARRTYQLIGLSVPPPDLLRGERGWTWGSITKVSELINHDYRKKTPQNPKRMVLRELPGWQTAAGLGEWHS